MPSTASTRLIRVITKRSCNQLSFQQLDGGGDQEVTDEGEEAAATLPPAEVDTALVGPYIGRENLHGEDPTQDEVPEPMHAERHPRPLQRARERKAARTGVPLDSWY